MHPALRLATLSALLAACAGDPATGSDIRSVSDALCYWSIADKGRVRQDRPRAPCRSASSRSWR